MDETIYNSSVMSNDNIHKNDSTNKLGHLDVFSSNLSCPIKIEDTQDNSSHKAFQFNYGQNSIHDFTANNNNNNSINSNFKLSSNFNTNISNSNRISSQVPLVQIPGKVTSFGAPSTVNTLSSSQSMQPSSSRTTYAYLPNLTSHLPNPGNFSLNNTMAHSQFSNSSLNSVNQCNINPSNFDNLSMSHQQQYNKYVENNDSKCNNSTRGPGPRVPISSVQEELLQRISVVVFNMQQIVAQIKFIQTNGQSSPNSVLNTSASSQHILELTHKYQRCESLRQALISQHSKLFNNQPISLVGRSNTIQNNCMKNLQSVNQQSYILNQLNNNNFNINQSNSFVNSPHNLQQQTIANSFQSPTQQQVCFSRPFLSNDNNNTRFNFPLPLMSNNNLMNNQFPFFQSMKSDSNSFLKSNASRGRGRSSFKNKKRRKSSTESESEETPVTSSDDQASNTFEISHDCMRMSLRKRKAPCYKDSIDACLSGESGNEFIEENKSADVIDLDDSALVPFQQKDLVEGEIAIIEKVLACKPIKNMGNVINVENNGDSLSYGENDKEFLVKYKYFSYLHCEWATLESLSKKDKRAVSKVRRFLVKNESANNFMADEEYYNPDFVEIDRILDKTSVEDPNNGQRTTHYLVKWCSMAHEDSTWELEEDLCSSKIEEYKRLLFPKPEFYNFIPRPQPVQFFKIEKSPEYNDGNVLRDYQLEGLNWLRFCWYNWQNCILADEMGLGKTIQTIAFLVEVKKYGIRGPFLIIAPLSTITNWQREFETWSDINAVVYHGTARSRQIILQHEVFFYDEQNQRVPDIHKFEAIITTYEMIICDKEFLYSVPWRCLVIDEAHRLKNRNCKLLEGLNQLRTEHRILLTGTPLQNNVEELYSLLSFLDPARTISPEAFLHEFGNLQVEGQLEKLQSLLKPIILRRLKEDVESNIAPKEETIIEVEMTLVQKRIYRAILERNFSFLSNSGHSNSIPNLMNTMMELRKCCNHPFLITGCEEKILTEYRNNYLDFKSTNEINLMAMIDSSGKLVLIDKLLKRLRCDGHKVLIFSQMVRVLDLLEDYLIALKFPYERIDGHVRGYNRQAAIDRFSKEEMDRFVFLLCTRAGGLGINLTAADTVIIFDSDWNPQNDLQAQARCHRIGQKKPVKVYRLICRNSYEKEMFQRAGMKLGLDKAVLQSLNSNSKEIKPNQPTMTKKEIENLLRHGAYGALLDEDIEESSKFCAEDIDQILERRTTIVKISGEGAGSTFAKASFVSDRNRLDFDVDDPDFWIKWATNAKIDSKSSNGMDLNIEFPRIRKQTQRFGKSTEAIDCLNFSNSMEEDKQKHRTTWNLDFSNCVLNLLINYGFNHWNVLKINAQTQYDCYFSNTTELKRLCLTITIWCWNRLKLKPFVKDSIEKIIAKNKKILIFHRKSLKKKTNLLQNTAKISSITNRTSSRIRTFQSSQDTIDVGALSYSDSVSSYHDNNGDKSFTNNTSYSIDNAKETTEDFISKKRKVFFNSDNQVFKKDILDDPEIEVDDDDNDDDYREEKYDDDDEIDSYNRSDKTRSYQSRKLISTRQTRTNNINERHQQNKNSCVRDFSMVKDISKIKLTQLVVNRQFKSILKLSGKNLLMAIFNMDIIGQMINVKYRLNDKPKIFINSSNLMSFLDDSKWVSSIRLPDIPSFESTLSWWKDIHDKHLLIGIWIYGFNSHDLLINDQRLAFYSIFNGSSSGKNEVNVLNSKEVKKTFDKRLKKLIVSFCKIKRQNKNILAKNEPVTAQELKNFYKLVILIGIIKNESDGTGSIPIYDFSFFRNNSEVFSNKSDEYILSLWSKIERKCIVVNMCNYDNGLNIIQSSCNINKNSNKNNKWTFFKFKRANKIIKRVQLFNHLRSLLFVKSVDELLDFFTGNNYVSNTLPQLDENLHFPSWWKIGLHDYYLIFGVTRFGLNHKSNQILADKSLVFESIVKEKMVGDSGEVFLSSTFRDQAKLIDWPENKEIVSRLEILIEYLNEHYVKINNTIEIDPIKMSTNKSSLSSSEESLSLSPNQQHSCKQAHHLLPPVSPSSN